MNTIRGPLLPAGLLVFIISSTACSLNTKLANFRERHEAAFRAGQLTQSWIIAHLGMPHATVGGPNGTIWAYQYQEYSAVQCLGMGLEAFGAGYQGGVPLAAYAPPQPSECAEYILFFDSHGILRQWQQRHC